MSKPENKLLQKIMKLFDQVLCYVVILKLNNFEFAEFGPVFEVCLASDISYLMALSKIMALLLLSDDNTLSVSFPF